VRPGAAAWRWRTLALAAFVWVALAAAPAAPGERSVEVYRPAHRLAEELLPLAETALAGEGSAALDPGTNAVVLIGAPAAVARTLELLRAQDRAARTVVIHYESRTLRALEQAGVEIAWRVEAGDVRIGNVVGPGGEGLAIGLSAKRGEGTGSLRGILRVLDGQSGQLGAGRTVPVPLRGRYGPDTAFVSAERGFLATPRVLGDGRVRVAIAPSDATVDERGRVTYSAAATEVELRPGETVVLGSLALAEDARQLGSRSLRAHREEEELLLLRVELEGGEEAPKPGAPPGGTGGTTPPGR